MPKTEKEKEKRKKINFRNFQFIEHISDGKTRVQLLLVITCNKNQSPPFLYEIIAS